MSNVVPTMKIYIAEIPYEDIDGSKYRPAIVVGMNNERVKVLKITDEYEDKSEAIKELYYPIKNWQQAGLKRKSYVDCHRAYAVTQDYLLKRRPIGELESSDKTELYAFIRNLLKAGKIK